MQLPTTRRFSSRAAAIALAGSLAFASYLRGSDGPYPEPCGAPVREAAAAGSTMVFTVTEHWTVWRTDGTAPGTFALVGGGDDAAFGDLRTVGDRVVFTRDVYDGPLELWSTDGSPDGTVQLADLVGGWYERRRVYDDTIGADGRRYLVACRDYGHCRWWVTDGTAAGTIALLDFRPRLDDDDDPEFEVTSIGDDAVYLVLTRRRDPQAVWRTDGTLEGTTMLADPYALFPTNAGECKPGLMTSVTASTGLELWLCDATGTPSPLADINPGPAGSDPAILAYLDRRAPAAFFSAFEPAAGRELWITDGTSDGTRRVADVNPGPADSDPQAVEIANGALIFLASASDGERQLWLTDGTAANTTLVVRDATSARSTYAANVNGARLFRVDRAGQRQLWRSDGTPAGTFQVAPGTFGNTVGLLDGAFLFVAAAEHGATQLWRSNGSPAGTEPVATLHPTSGYDARSLAYNTGLTFTTCGAHACSIWQTDGTSAGTVLITDIPQRLDLNAGYGAVAVGPEGRVLLAVPAAWHYDLWLARRTPATWSQLPMPPGCSTVATTTSVPASSTSSVTTSAPSSTTTTTLPTCIAADGSVRITARSGGRAIAFRGTVTLPPRLAADLEATRRSATLTVEGLGNVSAIVPARLQSLAAEQDDALVFRATIAGRIRIAPPTGTLRMKLSTGGARNPSACATLVFPPQACIRKTRTSPLTCRTR